MTKTKILVTIAQAIASMLAYRAVDKTLGERPKGEWPSMTRLTTLGALAAGLVVADAAIERKFGLTDDKKS